MTTPSPPHDPEPAPASEPRHAPSPQRPRSAAKRVLRWLVRAWLPSAEHQLPLPVEVLVLTLLLALMGLVDRAQGDTLRVGTPREANGGITVRARASAPPESEIWAGLYTGHCPPAPSSTHDFYTPVTEEASPIWVWPQNGESGPLQLCVWVLHQNETVGARADRRVRLRSAAPSYASPAATVAGHAIPVVLWLLLGAGGSLLLLVAVCACAGIVIGAGPFGVMLLVRGHYKRKRRRREREQEREQIEVLQHRARTDAPAPAEEDAPTLEFDAIPDESASGDAAPRPRRPRSE